MEGRMYEENKKGRRKEGQIGKILENFGEEYDALKR
jgi:hypothetical protein